MKGRVNCSNPAKAHATEGPKAVVVMWFFVGDPVGAIVSGEVEEKGVNALQACPVAGYCSANTHFLAYPVLRDQNYNFLAEISPSLFSRDSFALHDWFSPRVHLLQKVVGFERLPAAGVFPRHVEVCGFEDIEIQQPPHDIRPIFSPEMRFIGMARQSVNYLPPA